MIEVEHPTLGVIEFPDGTPPEQIKAAIQKAEQKSAGGQQSSQQPQKQQAEDGEGFLNTLQKFVPVASLPAFISNVNERMNAGDDALTAIGSAYGKTPQAGILETAATMGTGIAGEVVGGLRGIAAGGGQGGDEAIQQTREAMVYMPRGEAGQQNMRRLGVIGEGVKAVEDVIGEGAVEAGRVFGVDPNSKAAAVLYAAGSSYPAAVSELLGFGLARGGIKAAGNARAPVQRTTQQTMEAVAQGAQEGITKRGQREAGARQLAEDIRPDSQIIESAQTLGIEPTNMPPEVVSGNAAFREVAGTARSVPGSPQSFRYKEFLDEVNTRVSETLDDIEARPLSQVNEDVAGRLESDVADAARIEGELYTAVDDAVSQQFGAAAEVRPTVVQETLMRELESVGGDASKLTALERRLLGRFFKRKDGAWVPQTETWQSISKLRRELNQARDGQNAFGNASTGELKRYAGLVSGSQKRIADELGVADQFQQALDATGAKKRAQEAQVTLMGKQLNRSVTQKLEQAVKAGAKGRQAEVSAAIDEIPADMRGEVVTSMVADQIMDMRNMDARINVAGFNKWFNSLNANPQAKAAIYKHLSPEARTQVEAIGKLTSAIKRANEDKIATGRIVAAEQGFKLGESMIGKVLRAGLQQTAGNSAGAAGSMLAGEATAARQAGMFNRAASQVLASPEFQRHAVNVVQNAPRRAQQASERALAQSGAWQSFVKGAPESTQRAINAAGVSGFLTAEDASANTAQP